MTSLLRRTAPAALTVIAVGALALFIAAHAGYLRQNYLVRPGTVVFMAALIVLSFLLRTVAYRGFFGAMKVSVTTFGWFRLIVVSSFANYLPFSAGIAARAFYLKRVHGLPYGSFVIGQLALALVFIGTDGFVGLAALAAAYPADLVGSVGALFAVMLAGAIVLLCSPSVLALILRHRHIPGNLPQRLKISAWLPAVPAEAAILAANALVLKLSFAMGPVEAGFGTCLVFTAASVMTRLFSLTPGAIGVREFLVGGVAYLVGFGARDAVIASTLSRLVEIAVTFSLGSVFSYGLSRETLSAPSPREEPFPGSTAYWEQRYAGGGGSGRGSRGKAAEKKASFLNDFVSSRSIHSVVELGCGDSRQLALAQYDSYLGFDVSPTAVENCRRAFSGDDSKQFRELGDYAGERAELALSLDVIYHLVEDAVFARHMEQLFGASSRFVVIYSTNTERQPPFGRSHVRHRRFTDWVARHAPHWKLVDRLPGWHRLGRLYRGEHRADFFVYELFLPPGKK